jgi:hypothetical protein
MAKWRTIFQSFGDVLRSLNNLRPDVGLLPGSEECSRSFLSLSHTNWLQTYLLQQIQKFVQQGAKAFQLNLDVK